MVPDSRDDLHLKNGFKPRHRAMIAVGGALGAGLFDGSGVIIGEVDPGAFLTYGLPVLIVMVMRMLGEMAVANPSTGSFAYYARQSLGSWPRFSTRGCAGTHLVRRAREDAYSNEGM